jgi:hypothetical protein
MAGIADVVGMAGMVPPTVGQVLQGAAAAMLVNKLAEAIHLSDAVGELCTRSTTRAALQVKLKEVKENDLEKRRELDRAVRDLEKTLGDYPGENPDIEGGGQPDPRWAIRRMYDYYYQAEIDAPPPGNYERLREEKTAAREGAQGIHRFREGFEARVTAVLNRFIEAERIAAERVAAADLAVSHDRTSRTGWFSWW